MHYTFENCIYKNKMNESNEKKIRQIWKKKRISSVDDRNILSFFKTLPNCNFFVNINDDLTNIPYLPNCQVFLNIGNKKLKKLRAFPNCHTFSCRKSSLTKLPSLPKAKFIECNNNNITSIGNLPNCTKLDCHSNPLTSISYNKKLLHINCNDTLLKTLTVSKDCVCDTNKNIKINYI